MKKKVYHCERKEFKMRCARCNGKENCNQFVLMNVEVPEMFNHANIEDNRMVYNDADKTLTIDIEGLDFETDPETTDEEIEQLKKEFELDSEDMYRDKALIKALRGLQKIMKNCDNEEGEV